MGRKMWDTFPAELMPSPYDQSAACKREKVSSLRILCSLLLLKSLFL